MKKLKWRLEIIIGFFDESEAIDNDDYSRINEKNISTFVKFVEIFFEVVEATILDIESFWRSFLVILK